MVVVTQCLAGVFIVHDAGLLSVSLDMPRFDRSDVELSLTGQAAGRAPTRERPRSTYHTVARVSEVDETLFKSSNAKLLSSSRPALHTTAVSPASDAGGAAPLSLSPDVRPLGSTPSTARSGPASARCLSSPGRRLRTHNKYRLVRHTPSYVDEMLFGSSSSVTGDGPGDIAPSWRAPWNKERFTPPLLFDPVDRVPPPAAATPRLRPPRLGAGPFSASRTRVSQPKSPWK